MNVDVETTKSLLALVLRSSVVLRNTVMSRSSS